MEVIFTKKTEKALCDIAVELRARNCFDILRELYENDQITQDEYVRRIIKTANVRYGMWIPEEGDIGGSE